MNESIKKLIESGKWQPIENAPHNRNTLVLYKNCADKDRVVKACFYEAGTLQANDDYDGDDVDENGYMTTEKWYEQCESHPDGLIYELEETPTHFRPIPDDRLANALQIAVEALERISLFYVNNHEDDWHKVNSTTVSVARNAIQQITAVSEGKSDE